LAAALALAVLARAEPDYVQVACKLNGSLYGGGPLIQWQAASRRCYGNRAQIQRDVHGRFRLDARVELYFVPPVSALPRYHLQLRLRSGASAWRVDGHVEVNHTYSASLTPSVYTFPLWHPQYTSDKSVSGAVASYSFGWHSAYPYTFPAWPGSLEPSSPTSGLASIRVNGSVNRIYVQLTVYNASGALWLGVELDIKAVYYCPNPPATLSFKTVELRRETQVGRTEGWYLVVPFTLSYASEDGSVSGTVSGYTGFTTSYRVSNPPAAIIFALSPQLGGEIYAPLRVWEWSSSGAGASYTYGNVTHADLYGGWLRTQELTGRYKLIYKVDYTDTEQTQPARVIVEKGSDAKGWTTLAVHDQPTSVIVLDVELNGERVRFRAERVTSSGSFMAGVTAALAIPLPPFSSASALFRCWTADCSHLGECKFAADCTWNGWYNESCQVSITPSTCLPVIAGVRPGETGYVTVWFALRTRALMFGRRTRRAGARIYGAPVRVCAARLRLGGLELLHRLNGGSG